MKTTLIHLEAHDDLISVRDRMSWAKTERILLVWPSRRKVALRPLDLTLLKRHAVSLGAQLALATRSASIRQLALEAGIPVYKTSGEAQKSLWEFSKPLVAAKGRSRRRRRNLRAGLANSRWQYPDWAQSRPARIAFFSVGILAVLALAMIFIPSTEIKLDPKTIRQETTLPLILSPSASGISLAGVLPMSEYTYEVSGTYSQKTSGSSPSSADREKLAARLSSNLEKQALIEITSRLPEGSQMVPGSLELVEIENTFSPPEDVPGDTLTLNTRHVYRARYFSSSDLKALAGAVLTASLPEGFTGVSSSLSESTSGEPQQSPDGDVAWTLLASQDASANLDENLIRQTLRAMPVRDSQVFLSTLPLDVSPIISVFPSFWPWNPMLPARIYIEAGE